MRRILSAAPTVFLLILDSGARGLTSAGSLLFCVCSVVCVCFVLGDLNIPRCPACLQHSTTVKEIMQSGRQRSTFSSGDCHTAAVTPEGKVICWGDNTNRQCRVPSTLENVVAMSCGNFHTMALVSDGTVVC
jgi:hypothetical protein